LQVVFRALSKKISGKDGLATLEINGPYAYGNIHILRLIVYPIGYTELSTGSQQSMHVLG